MTIAEVAEVHRVTRRTVERWISEGVLAASKLPGGGVRIAESAARALLKPVPASPEAAGAALAEGGDAA